MVKFEIRQQVRSVRKAWLEVIHSGEFERPMRNEYDSLVKALPEEYFEFVRVEITENCIAFTPLTGERSE